MNDNQLPSETTETLSEQPPQDVHKPSTTPDKQTLSLTASRKAKEWERARKETLRKRQQQLEALREELKRQDTLQQSAEEERRLQLRQKSLHTIERMRESKAKWTKQRESLQLHSTRTSLPKPLFQVLEEKHRREVESAYSQKLQAQLASMKVASSALEKAQIQEHLLWYNNFKKQQDAKKQRFLKEKLLDHQVLMSTQRFSGSLGAILAQEERRTAEEVAKQQQAKLARLERAKQYGAMVRDVYRPSVTPKADPQPKPLLKTPVQTQVWKPRKYPVNPLVPTPEPRPVARTVDFLSEQRGKRKLRPKVLSEIEPEGPASLSKLQALSDTVTRDVRLKEIVADDMDAAEALQTRQEADELLLQLVKTKLNYFCKLAGAET